VATRAAGPRPPGGQTAAKVVSSGVSPNSPPGIWSKPAVQITAGFDGDRWVTAPEATAYDT
jgi:hypothetical protein